MIAPVLVFALTWLLIAFRRLRILPIGRPAGAMLGAVGMIAVGALTPSEAWAAIDHDTLALLLGMMILTAYLERAGWFGWASHRALTAAGDGFRLLVAVGWLAAGLSAWLVNDTVCLFLTPLLVATCRASGLPLAPYLLVLATSANLGSAATLVGNPQNMLIGSLSGIPFTRFLAVCGPAALVGMLAQTGLMWVYWGRALRPLAVRAPELAAPVLGRDAALSGAVTLGVAVAFLAGLNLGVSALGGAVALFVLDRREPREAFAAVDWELLLFFAGLFIAVAGLASTGVVEAVWALLAPHLTLGDAVGAATFTASMTLASNVVSNVPLVLLIGPQLHTLGDPATAWLLLAFVTTVAGNLTLVGSVANLIVAERARPAYDLGFFEYLRFGAVSTVMSLGVGVPVVLLLSGSVGA